MSIYVKLIMWIMHFLPFVIFNMFVGCNSLFDKSNLIRKHLYAVKKFGTRLVNRILRFLNVPAS